MKIFLGMALTVMFMTTGAYSADEVALKTQKDKVSYSMGLNLGNSLMRQPFEVDVDLFMTGFTDAVKKRKPLMTDQEMRETEIAFQKEMGEKQAQMLKAAAEKNKKEGEAFLAENKKKEGVKVLPSGLQYKVIKEGTGAIPKATDSATVNYKGTLINGTEFDSSYKRGQPATFQVNGVIKGWTEALQLMKAGSKWQLFVPSDLAYGEKGAGPQIGPNAVLIFEVELLSIN
jgi:FKBP-type peptidyl-prolyl cis-trans isomerase FklB